MELLKKLKNLIQKKKKDNKIDQTPKYKIYLNERLELRLKYVDRSSSGAIIYGCKYLKTNKDKKDIKKKIYPIKIIDWVKELE